MDLKVIQAIKKHAIPLTGESDLTIINEKAAKAKYVLLGEASHGTSEFYTVRAEISKKLITEKGFTFIAVEGDWPACQAVNRYIKGYDKENSSARDVLHHFNRWPTWMWANEEIIDLIEWMKEYNKRDDVQPKIGFYGIDMYSLWESMEEVIAYLTKIDSPDVEIAKKAFTCFEPFNRDNQEYAVSAGIYSEGCIDEVAKLLAAIQKKKNQYPCEQEQQLNLVVNALVAYNAEHYYRSMVVRDEESWNIRDTHMVHALNEVMKFYGSKAKAIVWEHNTHVGDARATDMANNGMVNVGELIRQQNSPEDVFIIGFGTNRGTVIAADEWGVDLDVKVVPKAVRGSWEDLMHRAGAYDKMLFFDKENEHLFEQRIGHRAIGVVYRPEFEQFGNYVPSIMSERYDGFIYIDESSALKPLAVERVLL
ncbi:erythromycin esterase family protein [Terribacillus saccharophilus]|uniref:erythromycin esterase family protein n=1 Tax=Terribacillus saccharophilus TaxID=361277 RepID=UPI0039827F94